MRLRGRRLRQARTEQRRRLMAALFALLALPIAACSVGVESERRVPSSLKQFRADNGLLAAPQIMQSRPSAEQTAYRLAIGAREGIGGAAVHKPPPAQLRRLVLDQREGVARVWLLGLAGTAYPTPLLRNSDLDGLASLRDPRGGLAPTADLLGKASAPVRWDAVLKVQIAARLAKLRAPAVRRLAEEAAVADDPGSATIRAAICRLAEISCRSSAAGQAAPRVGELPELAHAVLAGRPVSADVVEQWLERFERGTIGESEVGLLWLLGEIVHRQELSPVLKARYRQLAQAAVGSGQDASGFFPEPATRLGDPAATYLFLTLARAYGEAATDPDLAAALRDVGPTDADPWLRLMRDAALRLADLSASRPRPAQALPWPQGQNPDAYRNLLLLALIARQTGQEPDERTVASWPTAGTRQSALTSVSTWVATGKAPRRTRDQMTGWLQAARAGSGKMTSHEIFTLVAAAVVSGSPGETREEAKRIGDAYAAEVLRCHGVPWLPREHAGGDTCDLRAALAYAVYRAALDRPVAERLFDQ
ncbi:hypothetical protein TH66_17840 [Carbonactinospora thermoautotrophica]|uniref:Uncharacterized protein n=2 Tax=Carbonactinospora thermoautotrophica TaxID=1469144 RepID=A0A132MI13_9ACTN|nr:hypothetical protein TH66_17840 [Carbonactinospora thermoautotrophica]KWX06953.1 hypothetical protein TR74_20375 [Carbonactinospora thermoautotrophica]